MKIDWKKTISAGIVIWVVVFIVTSILIALKLQSEFLQWLIVLIAVVITGYKLTKKMTIKNQAMALVTGIIWVVVLIILDLLVTTYFTTMAFFQDWKIWVSYVVILLIPILTMPKTERKTEAPPPAANPPSM